MVFPRIGWLAYSLAKLQFFSGLGVVFWTLLATAVQVTSTLLVSARQMSEQFVLPLRVIFVMVWITRGAFYSCSPLAIYSMGKHAPAFLNTKDARVPKYWYLLVLSLMLSLAYNTILLILFFDSTIKGLAHEIFNLALVLLMGTVFGIATSTFEKSCDTFKPETYENLAVNGKSLLKHYRILKDGSQLVMIVVLVFQTSHLILKVNLLKNKY